MGRDERFQQFVDALREDQRTRPFVGRELMKGILAKFGDNEALKQIIVTSLLIRKDERMIAFSTGAVVITNDALYVMDADTILRRPWTEVREWFLTGLESNRRHEVVFDIDEATAVHMKCATRDLYVLEESLGSLGFPKGDSRAVEDSEELMWQLFRDDLLDHLDAAEEQFNSRVPNEVARKYKKQPQLLTDWWWKMWEKRQ